MSEWWILADAFVQVLAVWGVMVIVPGATRRGLLFGAYVGPAACATPEAGRLRSAWNRLMTATLIVSLALLGVLAWMANVPMALVGSQLALLAGMVIAYCRAHLAARRLIPDELPVAPVVATIAPERLSLTPGLLAMVFAIGAALFAGMHAMKHYHALPEQIPTHFNLKGVADGWSARSVGTVLILPVIGAVTGIGTALLTMLVARAKRAVRMEGLGLSLAAQTRFRAVLTWMVGGVSALTSLLLATISYESIEVALGRQEGLSGLTMLVGASVPVYSLAMIAYLGLRIGQGGARLEEAVADAPLTRGLADNRCWKMGVLYVNPDDPSIFVEHRFGIGYTLNLGNRRAQWVLGTILLIAAALALLPWLMLGRG